jgi:hypothetical protein
VITRKQADVLVAEVCERARAINAGDYAHRIVRLEVFGSYLTDKDPLGDLDLMVTLAPAYDDLAQQRNAEDRARAGRTFRNLIEDVYWPKEEVHRALKNRKRAISIHDASERQALIDDYGSTFREIFNAPRQYTP